MAKKKLQAEVSRSIELTDLEVENFTLRIEKFLTQNARKILKNIKLGKVSASEAAQALGSLERALADAGLQDIIDQVPEIYAKQYRSIKKTFEISTDREFVLSEVDLDTAETLIRFKTNVIQSQVTSYIYNVNDAVLSSVFGGETPDVDEILEKYGSRIASNVATEVNTGIAAFNRTVTFKKAEDVGLNKFVYLGPIDKITRPFCSKIVNRVFSIKDIKAMDNGQGLDVMTYGGGYNCRHQWRPVSEELAKEYGDSDSKAG